MQVGNAPWSYIVIYGEINPIFVQWSSYWNRNFHIIFFILYVLLSKNANRLTKRYKVMESQLLYDIQSYFILCHVLHKLKCVPLKVNKSLTKIPCIALEIRLYGSKSIDSMNKIWYCRIVKELTIIILWMCDFYLFINLIISCIVV